MGSKTKHSEGDARRITIKIGDEVPEENTSLIDMLRDGERPKPGEPGVLADRLGHEWTEYLAHQVSIAIKRGTSVNGTFSITMSTATGPMGDTQIGTEVTTKRAKMPHRLSMVMTDEEGTSASRPARPERDEPLTDYLNEKAKTTADPKVGSASSL